MNKILVVAALVLCSQFANAAAPYLVKAEPIPHSKAEQECLAKNIFFEAGVEPISGKFAVAQVTWNRAVAKGRSICDVVYQKAQFSWTLFKKKRREKPRGRSWEVSQRVAALFLSKYRMPALSSAWNYHATYVSPYWGRSRQFVAIGKVGTHIFYRQA